MDVLRLTGAVGAFPIAGKNSPRAARKDSASDSTVKPKKESETATKRMFTLNQSLNRPVSLEKGLDSAEECVKKLLPDNDPRFY